MKAQKLKNMDADEQDILNDLDMDEETMKIIERMKQDKLR